jgi:hypothetical protein
VCDTHTLVRTISKMSLVNSHAYLRALQTNKRGPIFTQLANPLTNYWAQQDKFFHLPLVEELILLHISWYMFARHHPTWLSNSINQ